MFGFALLFVILAIVIGVVTHSWIWGVVSFIVAIIAIPRIILWVSGSNKKRAPLATEDQLDLLDQLEEIGRIKNELSLDKRGFCNIIGLYVQLREAAEMVRLSAGNDKLRPQIDAWRKSAIGPWEVRKYESGGWEILVEPTLELVNWLANNDGVPEEFTEALHSAVQTYKKEGVLELPQVGHTEIEFDLQDFDTLNIGGEVEEKTPLPTGHPKTPIEEYDQELLDSIGRMRKYIDKAEDQQKEFMRSQGASEITINEVVQKARLKGSPISFDGSSSAIYKIVTLLTKMVPAYKQYSFRFWIPHSSLHMGSNANILTNDGRLTLDTSILSAEDRDSYEKFWNAAITDNYAASNAAVFKCYPDEEFMSFMSKMLANYEEDIFKSE